MKCLATWPKTMSLFVKVQHRESNEGTPRVGKGINLSHMWCVIINAENSNTAFLIGSSLKESSMQKKSN